MMNTRTAKFIMEVAPPQFISIMRHRSTKMLETISEEENDSFISLPNSFSITPSHLLHLHLHFHYFSYYYLLSLHVMGTRRASIRSRDHQRRR
ncbi:hypothetical protein MLD38_010266 [Melastoma candidum]|uniref:Uncharacterized protein n=1 Tax=Melastoma candidum TaxID=119954 RepID=A0ACB9R0D3_9MYRT|nr:hypothetical protein MLD38_010266 [Melastoma candidum]